MTGNPIDPTVSAPVPPPPAEAAHLRAFLRSVGYDEDGLRRALGTIDPPVPGLGHLPRLEDATSAPSAFNVLARWFFLGRSVPIATADAHLPAWVVATCLDARLLAAAGDDLEPCALLVPCGPNLLASDRYGRSESASGFHHVLSVSPTARHLLRFLVPGAVGSALDLCAGCGVHAIDVASRATRVTAADLNPRAAVFAAFNARLNGCGHVESVTGDGFDAVAGRRFDLITCNPPFVIAPSRRYLYRDNDLELDAFCRDLLRRAPDHLAPGGICQVICEWVEVEGEPWAERLTGWLTDLGCDAWVLRANTQPPARYAEMRLAEMARGGADDDGTSLAEWMSHYRTHRVQAIHGGFILLRRRDGANWTWIDDLREPPTGDFGPAIARGLAARDFLADHADDETLLSTRPRLAPEARREETASPAAEGGWALETTRLRLAHGLPRPVQVDAGMADLLGRLDGTRSVDSLVADVARAAGVGEDQARVACARLVRTMIERGYLCPPDA